MSYKDAAQAAGISYDTFNRWRNDGAKDNAPCELRDFYNALQIVEAEGKLVLVDTISKEAKKNWKAAAWLLEKRYPKEWGKSREESPAEMEPHEKTREEKFCEDFGIPLDRSLPSRVAAKQKYDEIEEAIPDAALLASFKALSGGATLEELRARSSQDEFAPGCK